MFKSKYGVALAMIDLRKPLLAGLWLALATLFVGLSPASALTCHDSPNGTIIPCVQPAYLYQSAGATQFITAGTLAAATPLTVPNGASIAEICVETAGVRYRDDGVAPTASVGIPIVGTSTAPACFAYAGPLSAIQFIAISGSPTMDVAFYKPS